MLDDHDRTLSIVLLLTLVDVVVVVTTIVEAVTYITHYH